MSDEPIDRIGALAMALQALFTRFSEGYNSLHADVTDLRIDILAEIRRMHADIMGKIDGSRDDIGVNMSAIDMARKVNDNTRDDVKQMREQMLVMWKQLKKAQADIRQLKGEP